MHIDMEYNSPTTYHIDLSMLTGIPPESGHNRHTDVSLLSFVTTVINLGLRNKGKGRNLNYGSKP
jgi:hypothetical protein